MTVLWRGRTDGRMWSLSLNAAWPRTWGVPPETRAPTMAPGSAKPGRGGRRKRRRRAATTRAALEWLAAQALGRPALWPRKLEGPGSARPAMPVIGRRERRRRAKLRRRRDRAEAQGRRATLVNPLEWCGPSMAAQAYREAVGWANRETIRTIAGAPPEMRLDRPQARIKI